MSQNILNWKNNRNTTSQANSVKNGYNFVNSNKTALLLSNVIDADHQNTCLFTNEGHFLSPLWILIGDIDQFHTLPIALTRLLEYISAINSVWKNLIHMTTMLRVGSL